jgi:thymidylate synthase (FAD)
MKVTLTRVTENPIGAIEEAACNCYNSEPTGGKIMKSCYKSGHHSVLEFCDFTFHIEGVSRALTHQLVRHRLASYAQRSQRYCGEENFDYTIPPSLEKDKEAKDTFTALMGYINMQYKKLQKFNIPNEDARYVLPNACDTVIEVKMNLRSLIHFMNERLCTRAQWEIRLLALEMRKCVLAVYPELAEFLVPKCEIHKNQPFCPEHSTCGKHPRLKNIYDDYVELQALIDETKNGDITDTDLAQKFWDTFIKPKGYNGKYKEQ